MFTATISKTSSVAPAVARHVLNRIREFPGQFLTRFFFSSRQAGHCLSQGHRSRTKHGYGGAQGGYRPRRSTCRPSTTLSRSHALTLPFSVRQLDFTPSARSGLGFTSDDSAAQSNIFAVEPKQYVSDSNTSSNVGGPAIAGAVAVGLIVAGIRILTTGEAELVVGGPDAGLKTLGAYAEMFAVKEVAAPVAAMEEAPELN